MTPPTTTTTAAAAAAPSHKRPLLVGTTTSTSTSTGGSNSPAFPAPAPSQPPPPPFLRHQSSSLASYTSMGENGGGGSSLSSLEEDVEGLVMSFLEYPDAFRVSLACRGLRARWPALRDGLESVALDPSGPHPTLTPRAFFLPLLPPPYQGRAVMMTAARERELEEMRPLYGKEVTPLRRLRRLVVRRPPAALLQMGAGRGNRGAWRDPVARAWQLEQEMLWNLRQLFPRLVELDLAGCRLGIHGAEELAEGVREGGGWPGLRRIDLRDNLLNSRAFTALAEAFCSAPAAAVEAAAAAAQADGTPHRTASGRHRGRRRGGITDEGSDDDDDEGAPTAPAPPPPRVFSPPLQLEEINLENNAIGPEAFAGPVRARLPPALRRLNLRDNHIGDAGVVALASLLGDGVGPEDAAAAGMEGDPPVEGGQCPLLEELCLGYNDVGPQGLRALAGALRSGNLPKLARLELSGNNLVGGDGEDGDEEEQQLPFAEEGGRDVRALAALAGALEAGCCPALAVLELDDTDMVDAGLVALARPLKHGHCPHLRELNLGGGANRLRGPGLDALGEALAAPRGPKHLETLSLDGCEDLSEEAITRFLAAALHAPYPLHNHNLEDDHFLMRPPPLGEEEEVGEQGPPRGFALARLRDLSLRGLNITNKGAYIIGAAMRRGALPELRRLSLEFTDVWDAGLVALASALALEPCPCPHFESLRLRCSLVSNAGAHALVQTLLLPGPDGRLRLPALKEVDLSSTSIVNSERLRRTKLRLRRLRPGLNFAYESINNTTVQLT